MDVSAYSPNNAGSRRTTTEDSQENIGMLAAEPPLANSELIARIISRIDASSQLLIILIGLGITNAVVRFGDDLSKGMSINGFLLFLVFSFYSVRFFVNNWIYLEQSYRREILPQYQPLHLLTIFRCAHLDLLLSIITGATCAFAGTMLNTMLDLTQEQATKTGLESLFVLLIFHYVSDLGILLHNWWFRHEEQEKYIKQALFKVFLWMCNNTVFTTLFAMLLFLTMNDFLSAGTIVMIFTYGWLMNSIIAVGITFGFSHYEITRERRRLRQELSPI
jgi:hypothetical protein